MAFPLVLSLQQDLVTQETRGGTIFLCLSVNGYPPEAGPRVLSGERTYQLSFENQKQLESTDLEIETQN